ncbi:hypothetical protein AtubIFM56815_003506 [Aspergillus tubingensis]|uniref:Nephrocystin 3-like N-terminal domain-containing protein n=1 Tax=Aspergillus tubingensis TaxID=5068 RepID=A0A9W6EPX9_ASPTU|nr:hypothetical protein AtubIFM56815_003506 [Aspergillus tubingensis]
MAELGVAASVIAVIQLTSQIVLLLGQYGNRVKSARDDISRLHNQLHSVAEISKAAQQLLEEQNNERLKTSHKLHVHFRDIQARLQELEREFNRSGTQTAIGRIRYHAFTWPFKAGKIEKLTGDLERCTQAISTALQIDQANLLLQLDSNTSLLDQNIIVGNLQVAEGAGFDSHAEAHNPTCHPQTRVDILQKISQWSEDFRADPMLLLSGKAGTGKSTIARTAARSFATLGILTASFFFRRGEGDRGKALRLVTTITTQLVENQPALVPYVKDAVRMDPRITQKSIREQFNKLILDPLSKAHTVENQPSLIIVVDALDECNDEDDIKLLIELFCSPRTTRNLRLRFLTTSRLELPIRLGLNTVNGAYRDLTLDEVPSHVIKNDIKIFLDQYELTLDRHKDSVTSVNFSHDSNFILSGSKDRMVRIWSARSELVASASDDQTARIWSTATGELRRILQHSDVVLSAVFSHDSKLVVSASNDSLVRIWSADTGELQKVLEGHQDTVNSVAFSHNSELIASASDDKTIRIWSTSTGEPQRILNGHNSLVTSTLDSRYW